MMGIWPKLLKKTKHSKCIDIVMTFILGQGSGGANHQCVTNPNLRNNIVFAGIDLDSPELAFCGNANYTQNTKLDGVLSIIFLFAPYTYRKTVTRFSGVRSIIK